MTLLALVLSRLFTHLLLLLLLPMKSAFVGGTLSFKGDGKKKKKKKAKKKSSSAKHDKQRKDEVEKVPLEDEEVDDDLTETERKALLRRREQERREIATKVASKSHRERVEEFNEKLGSLTEHNDIPRVRRRYRACSLLVVCGFLESIFLWQSYLTSCLSLFVLYRFLRPEMVNCLVDCGSVELPRVALQLVLLYFLLSLAILYTP